MCDGLRCFSSQRLITLHCADENRCAYMEQLMGQAASDRIRPSACDAMRAAIAEAAGREVFFAGGLDAQGLIDSARVLARGNRGAVPAVFQAVRSGEVVLHNHPSGDLEPSDEDLDLSALFANNGVGVYIVDNDVTRVYAVIEPFLDKEIHKLDVDELAALVGPAGRMSTSIPHYELRPQQVEMMRSVADAFNHRGVAVIEAPTGVGKTLAYLLPAILWSTRNKERVVVSTRTINLQEQIIHKDIPAIARALKEKFTAVLVKGRNNYLCLRKLERALTEASLFEDASTQRMLNHISAWSETTEDGSLSDLSFVPGRELWDKCCCEADMCSPTHCPSPGKCFIGKARREMARADILVVNHSMLFSDIAVKKATGGFSEGGVLPPYRRIIFDEAHSIEDSATEFFGAEATKFGSMMLFSRFVRADRNQERGLIPFVKAKLMRDTARAPRDFVDGALDIVDNELLPLLVRAREAVVVAFAALRSLAAERCREVGREIRWRLRKEVLEDPELRQIHDVYVLPASAEVQRSSSVCIKIYEALKRIDTAEESREPIFLAERMQLIGLSQRLKRLADVLADVTSVEDSPNSVRWIEIDSKDEGAVRLARCPLEVGEPLASWVYDNMSTIVMTSATLTVGRRFDFAYSRLGLDRVSGRPLESEILESPFDYEKQALLCIPTDISAPDSSTFLDETVDYCREILAVTRGHALVLFTSFYAMDYCFSRLEKDLRSKSITPLKQGMMARTILLDTFRQDTSSVLFATDSFWEGVDVAGDALQCVILPKLPFRVPTEPIIEARTEAIDARGGNSFMELAVPQAVIKFRQGFGRLVRRKTDTGAIVVLDKRIVTKRYGAMFFESLPGVRTVKGPRKGIVLSLKQFFNRPEEP